MTLLSFSKNDEVGIVEMGMNHSGELTTLAKIAVPDVCLITMVGQAHIGELGSQKAVINAKEELYLSCPEAHQIFNTDNEHTLIMYERARERLPAKQLTTFSSYRDEADVSLRAEKVTLHYIDVVGKIGGVSGKARVPIFGRQNVVNLMGASAIALLLEMDPKEIWQALPLCKSHWGRNQLIKIKKGTHVLFDGYNANPESMAAGIKNLYELSCDGQKVVILGEMMEMGKNAPELHCQLGEMVGNTDVDLVWFIGPHHKDFEAGLKQSLFRKTYYISDTYEQTLAIKILSVLNQQDIVLIKGSRGMKLERALQEWEPINFD